MYAAEKPSNVSVYVKLWSVLFVNVAVQFPFGQGEDVVPGKLADCAGTVSLPFFEEVSGVDVLSVKVAPWASTAFCGLTPLLEHVTSAV
jgi:hypothetical protein